MGRAPDTPSMPKDAGVSSMRLRPCSSSVGSVGSHSCAPDISSPTASRTASASISLGGKFRLVELRKRTQRGTMRSPGTRRWCTSRSCRLSSMSSISRTAWKNSKR